VTLCLFPTLLSHHNVCCPGKMSKCAVSPIRRLWRLLVARRNQRLTSNRTCLPTAAGTAAQPDKATYRCQRPCAHPAPVCLVRGFKVILCPSRRLFLSPFSPFALLSSCTLRVRLLWAASLFLSLGFRLQSFLFDLLTLSLADRLLPLSLVRRSITLSRTISSDKHALISTRHHAFQRTSPRCFGLGGRGIFPRTGWSSSSSQ
jgi:hypothetical protein